MADTCITSHVSWLDLFLEQKLFLSMHSEQVKLYSGDGFSVSLPPELLVASSGLARRTFITGEEGQAVLLPSVRGSTLLLLIEILRSGVTSNLDRMESIGDRLLDIREVMEMLDIPGCVDMIGIKNNNGFEIVTVKETKQGKNVQTTDAASAMMLLKRNLPDSYTPVVEITRMKVIDDFKLVENEVEEINSRKDVSKSRKTCQPRECYVCKKMYPSYIAWKTHVRRIHSESLFPCDHCGKKFILKKHLDEHVFRTHEGDRIMCCYCPLTYRNTESLNNHVHKYHRSELAFCRFCSMRFVSKDTLKIHMKNSHEGKFKCSECPSTFSKKAKLRSHVKGVHSGVRLVCPECSSTFSFSSSLQRHVLKSHKNWSDLEVECNGHFENDDRRDKDMHNRVESEEQLEQVDNIKTETIDVSNMVNI